MVDKYPSDMRIIVVRRLSTEEVWYQTVIALAFGADYSAFCPENPDVNIVACPDGMRPVIFKLERTQRE